MFGITNDVSNGLKGPKKKRIIIIIIIIIITIIIKLI